MKKILLISSIIALVAYCNASKMPTEWREFEVSSGDTVCDIAIDITPNEEDYRKAEYWITKKNNIEGASIYPGQVILVPVCE